MNKLHEFWSKFLTEISAHLWIFARKKVSFLKNELSRNFSQKFRPKFLLVYRYWGPLSPLLSGNTGSWSFIEHSQRYGALKMKCHQNQNFSVPNKSQTYQSLPFLKVVGLCMFWLNSLKVESACIESQQRLSINLTCLLGWNKLLFFKENTKVYWIFILWLAC